MTDQIDADILLSQQLEHAARFLRGVSDEDADACERAAERISALSPEPMTSPLDLSAPNNFYGWYDDASQPITKTSYDPPHDAPCPFCGRAITSEDVRTHSLMYTNQYAARSYFYRTHRTCAEKDKTNTAMDGFILDMIARNGD